MKRKSILYLAGTVIIVMAAALFRISTQRHTGEKELMVNYDTLAVEQPVVPRLYGIAIDSFTIGEGVIRRDQTIGKLLQQYNLPNGSMEQLLTYGNKKFDLRKIRMGNKYTVFLTPDSLKQLKYLVYEHTPVEYVVFDFADSLNVDVHEKEIITRQEAASGKIEHSLWETVTMNNINPMVALELENVYQWTIDFFGLQPEDSFSIIYDEKYVDSVSVGLGAIHAVYFRHSGKDLYAIPFVQDSVLSFFDTDGNSLRRAFLKAPLKYSRISSRYSSARFHPILKIVRPHYGVDYAAPTGTPVYAVGDGRVISTSYDSGSGNIVKIQHNSVYSTAYMHLSRFGPGIKGGVYVKQGDIIGYVGSTGLATGPHLDYRVYMNGSPIDPLKMESPPVDPIKPEYMASFDSVKDATIRELNSIHPTEYSIAGTVSQK